MMKQMIANSHPFPILLIWVWQWQQWR